jgi:hypothetical protein
MHCLLLALSMLIRIELSGTFCAGQSDMAHTVSNALTRSSEGQFSKCASVSEAWLNTLTIHTELKGSVSRKPIGSGYGSDVIPG